MKRHLFLPVLAAFLFTACFDKVPKNTTVSDPHTQPEDTVIVVEPELKEILPSDIVLTKELLYDKYTLEDVYPYKDTTRVFQWEKIKKSLH